MLLANHGALTVGADLFAAYYKMETIEHFAKISLVARMLGRENLLSREEVTRLQDLRGTLRHQGAGADLPRETGRTDESCQVVQAPRGRRTAARAGRSCARPREADARRGNSVNIPRAVGPDRRRRSEAYGRHG